MGQTVSRIAQRQHLPALFPPRQLHHAKCFPNLPPPWVFTRAIGATVSDTSSHEPIDRRGVVGGRLALYELADQCRDGALLSFEIRE